MNELIVTYKVSLYIHMVIIIYYDFYIKYKKYLYFYFVKSLKKDWKFRKRLVKLKESRN